MKQHWLFFNNLLSFTSLTSPSRPAMPAFQTMGSNTKRFTSFIPFCDSATNPNFTLTPRLKVSFPGYNGKVYWHETQMDTGSTGMLVSAWDMGYTDPSQLSQYEKGNHYLSSSRTYYTGHWIPVKFSFVDGDVSSNVSVFAVVSSGKCLEFDQTMGTCQKLTNEKTMPTGIAYLGVGFGRYGPEQPNATTDKNPLINIDYQGRVPVPSERITQGFIVTERGVQVGLTPEDEKSFKVTKLSRKFTKAKTSKLPEWDGIPISLSLSDKYYNLNGTVLFDTGINYMYLGVPKGAYTSLPTIIQKKTKTKAVKKGTHFSLKVGQDTSTPILDWEVEVGASDVTTPSRVLPRIKAPDKTFVNTGRFFYRRYHLLFDAENGLVGLRERQNLDAHHGGLSRASTDRQRILGSKL